MIIGSNGVAASLQTSFPIVMLMSAFLSIAFYSVLELILLILTTFTRWRGLYFWSLLIATWGIAINSLGYILKFFQVTPYTHFSVTLIILGWTSMVTGQSLVLYSRLHLVMHSARKLRFVLLLILTNILTCHIPIIVLVYCVNTPHPSPSLIYIYEIYESVQLTVFALQEIFISALYIYHAFQMLSPALTLRAQSKKTAMRHLVYVNCALIVLDVAVVGLQYAGLYEVQTSLKPAVYGVKLKLEFWVLNHLRSAMGVQRATESRTGDTRMLDKDAADVNANALMQVGIHVSSYTSSVRMESVGLGDVQDGVLITSEAIVESGEGRGGSSRGSMSSLDAEGGDMEFGEAQQVVVNGPYWNLVL